MTSFSVSLAWDPVRAKDLASYIYQDGVLVMQEIAGTQAIIPRLSPETTYTFTVKVRDWGINWSPLSDPVTATTLSRALDVTPSTSRGTDRHPARSFST